MEKNSGFVSKIEAFFAGKGFYIVLFLCVAVIGFSTWAMLMSSNGTIVENEPVDEPVFNENYEVYSAPTILPESQSSASNYEPQPPEVSVDEPGAAVSGPAEIPDADVPEAEVWSEDEPFEEIDPTYMWPVAGEIETPYAAATLIYNATMGDWRTHDGVDIAAELGSQVMAVSSGRVDSIYTDDRYGVTVVIDHMGGLKSIYSNLAEVPTVNVGDNVIAGDIIGSIGTTALVETGTVTHLHFAMSQDGSSIDPHTYLPDR